MVQGVGEAVILAAGFGSRMGTDTPKPLLPLMGLPLIEHKIRALLERSFRVTVVYNHPKVAEYIKKNFPQVRLVYNPHPERENGYSLLMAKEEVKGDFFLFMADHFYGEKFYELLDKRFDKNTAFVSRYCHDPQEATKIKAGEDLNVTSIGKELKEYNFFDTGMFFCKKEIFETAERLASNIEKLRLADVFQELARRGELKAVVVEDKWMDIDTKEELKEAEKLIKEQVIKGEDGPIARRINRRISLEITKRVISKPWATPNLFTFISLGLGIKSALFFALGAPGLGGLIAQITSIVDGCDGEIARIKRMRSDFGKALDSITDRYADCAICLGMAVYCGLSWSTLLALFLAATGVILFSYTWHLTKVRIKAGGRDVRLFIVMLGGLLEKLFSGSVFLTLIAVGLIAHVCSVISLISFFTQTRKDQHP